MFVSVRTYVGVTDFDKVVEIGNAGLLPIMQRQPGFHAYYVANCGGGILRSVSCFDSKDNAIAAYDAARGWVRDTLSNLVPNAPTLINGEVAIPEVVPKTVPLGAYMDFQSMIGVTGSRERGAQISRDKLVPDQMGDPGAIGAYLFRNEADSSNLLGVCFYRTIEDAIRLQDKGWAAMQAHAADIYPNRFTHSGGLLLTGAEQEASHEH